MIEWKRCNLRIVSICIGRPLPGRLLPRSSCLSEGSLTHPWLHSVALFEGSFLAGRTIVLSRCSSTSVGSSQEPVCTADTWMIVLRGDTSQWKRSLCDSCPIGPACSPPAQIAGMVARWTWIDSISSDESRAASRCSSSSTRASRKSLAGHETITPTFTNSSRSTLGTTRNTA